MSRLARIAGLVRVAVNASRGQAVAPAAHESVKVRKTGVWGQKACGTQQKAHSIPVGKKSPQWQLSNLALCDCAWHDVLVVLGVSGGGQPALVASHRTRG